MTPSQSKMKTSTSFKRSSWGSESLMTFAIWRLPLERKERRALEETKAGARALVNEAIRGVEKAATDGRDAMNADNIDTLILIFVLISLVWISSGECYTKERRFFFFNQRERKEVLVPQFTNYSTQLYLRCDVVLTSCVHVTLVLTLDTVRCYLVPVFLKNKKLTSFNIVMETKYDAQAAIILWKQRRGYS